VQEAVWRHAAADVGHHYVDDDDNRHHHAGHPDGLQQRPGVSAATQAAVAGIFAAADVAGRRRAAAALSTVRDAYAAMAARALQAASQQAVARCVGEEVRHAAGAGTCCRGARARATVVSRVKRFSRVSSSSLRQIGAAAAAISRQKFRGLEGTIITALAALGEAVVFVMGWLGPPFGPVGFKPDEPPPLLRAQPRLCVEVAGKVGARGLACHSALSVSVLTREKSCGFSM
jgi:hypothetical protein